jgi:hypothetical protein
MEYRLFDTPVAHVSTAEYHKDRERAMHLEDPSHITRLAKAVEFIAEAARIEGYTRESPGILVDLGCGDGGLLKLLSMGQSNNLLAYGYDFAPNNVEGAHQRALFNVEYLDVFPIEGDPPVNPKVFKRRIDIANMTEVIEHLTRPHEVLACLAPMVKWLVCSSPWNETPDNYADCHAWAWDMRGYQKLLVDAGFEPQLFARCGLSQVILAKGRV